MTTNIHIGISGSANLKQARTEISGLQAQFQLLNNQMQEAVFTSKALNMSQAQRTLRTIGSEYSRLAAETGRWETIQKKVNAQTVQYTDNLIKQKATLKEVNAARRSGLASLAYQEQLRLRSSRVSVLGRTESGEHLAQMMIPAQAAKNMDTFANRAGFAASQLKSASTQMVNFGKNTQWAGRQLTVGFTVPLMAAGTATGYFAAQADKELTRIAKVYDTTTHELLNKQDQQAAKEREIAQLRVDGMATAKDAAKQYGAAMTDTLSVQGELAATGVRGRQLQEATNETMRLATLGEMDYQTAMQATITLQSVFQQNSEELTKTFNFMNAVENQTSLSMQDFAQAIPVAAAPIKQMGGDMKDLAILMVSMKARGIDAAQGANAIKSAFNRLLNPGKSVRELFSQLTGQDVTQIIKQTKGEMIPTLQAVGEAVEDLEDYQKQQVLGKLFGTYQSTRITAMLTGITEDMADMNSQVGRTIELTKARDEELAGLAESELQRAQQSASGRLKRAVETIKVQLAEMGGSFLLAAVNILEKGQDLLEFLDKLPSGLKSFLKWTAIIVGAIGPLGMLVGLAANLTGTVVKGAASVVTLATKFKILDQNTVLATGAAKASQSVMQKQLATTQQMTFAIEGLSSAFREATTSQQAFLRSQGGSAAVGPKNKTERAQSWQNIRRSQYLNTNRDTEIDNIISSQGYKRDTAGRLRDGSGKFAPEKNLRLDAGKRVDAELTSLRASRKERLSTLQAENALVRQQQVEQAKNEAIERKRTANNRVMAASGALLTSSLIAQLIPLGEAGSTTEKIKNNIAQWGMVAGITLPVITRIGPALKSVPSLIATSAKNMSTAAKNTMSLQGGIKGVSSRLGGAAKSALTLGGAINPWAAGLAAAAGGAYLLYKHLSSAKKEAQNINDNSDGIAKILGYTPTEGVRVDNKGNAVKAITQDIKEFNEEYPGFADNMKDMSMLDRTTAATQFAFKVIDTGGTVEQAKEAMKLALMSARDMTEDQANKIIMNIDFDEEAVVNRVKLMKQKLQYALEDAPRPFLPNPFGDYGASDAKEAGQQFFKGLSEIEASGDMKAFEDLMTETLKKVNANVEKLGKEDGYRYANNFLKGISEEGGLGSKAEDKLQEMLGNPNNGVPTNILSGPISKLFPEYEALRKQQEQVNKLKEYEIQLNQGIAYSLTDIMTGDQNSLDAKVRALNAAKEQIAAGKSVKDLDALSLAYLKEIGNELGINLIKNENILSLLIQQTDELGNQSGKAVKASEVYEQYKGKVVSAIQADLSSIDKVYDKRAKSLQTSYNAQVKAIEAGQRAREAAFERQSVAMQNRHDREQRAFDKKWDARIDKVKKEEELRQQLFDAERNRIKRLSELQNSNIDFNAALRGGNLDEAAKILNSQRATSESNQLDDLDDRLGRKSDDQLDTLEKQRDDAQYKLKKHQDYEKQALDATKRRYQASVAAAKEAAQQQLEIQRASLEKEKEARKTNLADALKQLQEHKFTSTAEWLQYLKGIRDKFNLYGGESGKVFGDNAGKILWDKIVEDIRNAGKDKSNEKAGADVAGSMAVGAGKYLKLSNAEIKKFVSKHWATGYTGGLTINHEGGFAKGVEGRTGYPRSAMPYPSESLRLLKNDEFVMKGSAVRKYGADVMWRMNSGDIDPETFHARHEGGFVATGTLSGLMTSSPIVASLTTGAMSKYKEQLEAANNLLGGSMKGVDPNGWNKPWTGHYSTRNGHDYPLSYKPIYAPHSGKVTAHAIRGYEPRQRHGGGGFRSYGQWVDFNGGGTNLMFAHLSKLPASAGKTISVRAGQQIGVTGMTGNASGPHVHVERNHTGNNWQFGRFFKNKGISLRKGGTVKYDNTSANLHRGETVLTDNLTQKFKEGIAEFANGGSPQYNIDVTIEGNATRDDADVIAKAVIKRIQKEESRKGRGR